MRRALLFFVAVFITATTANSYPISPRPLRKLIIESEYIVIGHVREIKEYVKEEAKKEKYYSLSYTAIIDVSEQLQGESVPAVLEIPFSPGMICPAPPHYEANTDVIIFLREKDGKFYTHALSYGLKTLSLDDVAIYKTRIREMQDILKIQDKDTQFMESIEWLVKCTENRATCHEGTYELSRSSDFMSYYDRTEGEPFQHLLSADQKARLKSALLSNPKHPDLGLVDLVYPNNQIEVFNILLTNLEQLDEEAYWHADSYMSRILLFKTSDRLNNILEKYSEVKFEDKPAQQAKLINDFLQEVRQL